MALIARRRARAVRDTRREDEILGYDERGFLPGDEFSQTDLRSA